MPHDSGPDKTVRNSASLYEILGLHHVIQKGGEFSPEQLKEAYRRTLLQHHPDKSSTRRDQLRSLSTVAATEAYTVDQITQAYATLSDPKLRSAYDLELQSNYEQKHNARNDQTFRSGLESVDLDEMSYDDGEEMWYRSCRCGEDRGFRVKEDDLEEAADDGEVLVGCRGCSLWLRILFGVVGELSLEENGHRDG